MFLIITVDYIAMNFYLFLYYITFNIFKVLL